jgi:hypothetical protein
MRSLTRGACRAGHEESFFNRPCPEFILEATMEAEKGEFRDARQTLPTGVNQQMNVRQTETVTRIFVDTTEGF